jgi:tetratricopeptide (TPR) repeat protein
MEAVYGDRAVERAAEIARHYHRSATLPGAERGADYGIAAADRAAAAYAHDVVASLLDVALELLAPGDRRRPRLLGRLGLALVYSLAFREALGIVREAGDLVAATEGAAAAADYLAQAVRAMNDTGYEPGAAALAPEGLAYAGERRDATWVTLREADLRREAQDPDYVGIPMDVEEQREYARILLEGFADVSETDAAALERLLAAQRTAVFFFVRIGSRVALPAAYVHGEYRRGLPVWRDLARDAERQGRLALASSCWASVYRLHIALGEFAEAREARDRTLAFARRLTVPSYHSGAIVTGDDELHAALDEGWNDPVENVGPGFGEGAVRAWFAAGVGASAARRHARLGRAERAVARLAPVISAIERAPCGANNYVRLICDAAETLWLAGRTEWADVIERCLREKVIEPDLHYPMTDGRLAVARLAALQGRHDEACDWFAQARTVLDEQGARPLRAIVDYDEALMYARRGAPGDAERARPLVDVALAQFRTLGMPGWIRRAEALLKTGAAGEQESGGALR